MILPSLSRIDCSRTATGCGRGEGRLLARVSENVAPTPQPPHGAEDDAPGAPAPPEACARSAAALDAVFAGLLPPVARAARGDEREHSRARQAARGVVAHHVRGDVRRSVDRDAALRAVRGVAMTPPLASMGARGSHRVHEERQQATGHRAHPPPSDAVPKAIEHARLRQRRATWSRLPFFRFYPRAAAPPTEMDHGGRPLPSWKAYASYALQSICRVFARG